MYFVHPQIKLNGKNFLKIFSCFFRKPDLKNKLSFYFPKKQIVFTDMGRTAFKIIIEKLNLENFLITRKRNLICTALILIKLNSFVQNAEEGC